MSAASAWLHGGAAAVCLGWTVLILSIGRRSQAAAAAGATCATALWALLVALQPTDPLVGLAGAGEVLRSMSWIGLLLILCHRSNGPGSRTMILRFAIAAGLAAAIALVTLLPGFQGALVPSLGSPSLLARMGLALLVVVLAENVYRNADEAARWHVNLPAIALGGLAALDLVLYADAALSQTFSASLLDGRAVLAALATPLLAIAAVRDQRLRRDPPVSRTAMFHGTTLVVAGAFLLGVGAAGEALRRLDADWARTAQVSLLAGAGMALAVALASSAARSRLRRLVVDHFFTARYDYRREWLRCVAALSAPDAETPAATRALRALADPVDSPAGALFLRGEGQASYDWAGSWNLAEVPLNLPADHPLMAMLRDGAWIADIGTAAPPDLIEAFGPLWLAVPLSHPRNGLAGVVLLAPPRAPFPLDTEVFDLLRTIGREVATFVAERRAAERLADGRRLQDYAQRFAFVAHDVKTVATQLRLVLANAEDNIAEPEFQQDMLLTIHASADRIDALIARLRQPGEVQPTSRRTAGRHPAGRPHPRAGLRAEAPRPGRGGERPRRPGGHARGAVRQCRDTSARQRGRGVGERRARAHPPVAGWSPGHRRHHRPRHRHDTRVHPRRAVPASRDLEAAGQRDRRLAGARIAARCRRRI